MKYLLIDDLAESGWKNVLEKSVVKVDNSIDVATSYESALKKINKSWDIIFLDLRLSEHDHSVANIEDYSGFKILKEIRKSFNEINFCTPIILITASNKVWNIEVMRDNGIEGFYIKEHPDYKFDKKTSRKNLENLQSSFLYLKEIGFKRRVIWELCNSIISQLEIHSYFKTKDNTYANIKERITDKIKLGYTQLFKAQTGFEKSILPGYNESFSFIIFWSILEEITKGFTNILETWNQFYHRNTNWKFRNAEYFIERTDDAIVLNYFRESSRFRRERKTYDESTGEFKKYYGDLPINLSEVVYSLLAAYSIDDNSFKKLCDLFKPLNKYRNDNDFIHSSVFNIANKKLITENAIKEAYLKNTEILKFIKMVLDLKVNNLR
jgi:CheY-like chemotaxis protein